jgi:hypothetical protein
LLDKPVFKKMFLEHAELDQTDRKALSEDVERIRWLYTLKPETINIAAYQDSEREYPEIAILFVGLTNAARAKRIANFMHRAIPYPLILIFGHAGKVSVSVAEKRINQADKSKLVTLERWQTTWYDPAKPNTIFKSFTAAIQLHRLPSTNFFALYEAFLAQVIQVIAAERTGTYDPARIQDSKRHASTLREIDGLEREISELKVALKRENQMGNKVALNGKIRAHKDVILTLEASLAD